MSRSQSDKSTFYEAEEESNSYVTSLNSNDVLLGRGATSSEYSGNLRLRQLVLEHRSIYMASRKRAEKQRIAEQIIQAVHDRGGRFLRRITTMEEARRLAVPPSLDAWAVVSLTSSALFVKVKQLMRDVGEETQKKRKIRREEKRQQLRRTTGDIKDPPNQSTGVNHSTATTLQVSGGPSSSQDPSDIRGTSRQSTEFESHESSGSSLSSPVRNNDSSPDRNRANNFTTGRAPIDCANKNPPSSSAQAIISGLLPSVLQQISDSAEAVNRAAPVGIPAVAAPQSSDPQLQMLALIANLLQPRPQQPPPPQQHQHQQQQQQQQLAQQQQSHQGAFQYHLPSANLLGLGDSAVPMGGTDAPGSSQTTDGQQQILQLLLSLVQNKPQFQPQQRPEEQAQNNLISILQAQLGGIVQQARSFPILPTPPSPPPSMTPQATSIEQYLWNAISQQQQAQQVNPPPPPPLQTSSAGAAPNTKPEMELIARLLGHLIQQQQQQQGPAFR